MIKPQNYPRRALSLVVKVVSFIIVLTLLLCACRPQNASATMTPSMTLSEQENQGKAVFQGKGRCSSCHSLAEDTVLVGPSLAHIASLAETRVAGQSAQEYLLLSILRPDDFKPAGFEQSQMDSTLAKTLTSQEVDNVVAYLLTLK